MEEVLRSALEELEAGRSYILVTVIEASGHTPAKVGAKLLLLANHETIGTVGGGALEKLCIDKARELLAGGESQLIRYVLDEDAEATEEVVQTSMACGGRASVFFERVGGIPTVHLFGAGHIGSSIAYFLAPLAFRVSVYDDRDALLESLPDQPRQTKLRLPAPTATDSVAEGSFVVIATHSHELDLELLRSIISQPKLPRYVGLVASRRKWKLFESRLQDELSGNFDRSRLYAPCGLSVASRDPREIALSIVAEILAVRDGVEPIVHMRHRQEKRP